MAKAKAKRKGKKKGKQAKLSRGKKARKGKSKARKGAAKKKKSAARKPSPQRTTSYSEPTSMADTSPEVTTFGSDIPSQESSMESTGSDETRYSEYGKDTSSSM